MHKTALPKRWILLALSLLANVVLLASCLFIFLQFKKNYINYRHYRALPVATSQATTAQATETDIVLFGDSRVETWYPELASETHTIINAGVSGETTSEMRKRFEQDVLRLQPEHVLIQAGMNDLTASVTRGIDKSVQYIPTMHDNLHYFISTLKRHDINVIVTSIIPNKRLNITRRMLWHNNLEAAVEQANVKLKQLTETLGADWIDLDPLFLDSSGNPLNSLYWDTLHINYQGYDVLNARIEEYFGGL